MTHDGETTNKTMMNNTMMNNAMTNDGTGGWKIPPWDANLGLYVPRMVVWPGDLSKESQDVADGAFEAAETRVQSEMLEQGIGMVDRVDFVKDKRWTGERGETLVQAFVHFYVWFGTEENQALQKSVHMSNRHLGPGGSKCAAPQLDLGDGSYWLLLPQRNPDRPRTRDVGTQTDEAGGCATPPPSRPLGGPPPLVRQYARRDVGCGVSAEVSPSLDHWCCESPADGCTAPPPTPEKLLVDERGTEIQWRA